MKIALEGTACVGKTSCINFLKDMGYPVVNGNFSQHIKEFDLVKNSNSSVYSAYQIYLSSISRSNYIHNRSPLSSVIYDIINQVINNKISEAYAYEKLKQTLTLLKYIVKEWFIMVIYSTESNNLVLGRMKRRNIPTDIYSTEYVRLQNELWCFLARELNLPIIASSFATKEKTFAEIGRITNLVLRNKPIIFGAMSKKKPDTDAGIDLTSQDDHAFLANSTSSVLLCEKVYIPRGFYGQLVLRSSSASHGLTLFGGVIDHGYTGKLFASITSRTDLFMEAGTQVCQLIICPCVPCGEVLFSSYFPISSIRGEKCLGSTGGEVKIPSESKEATAEETPGCSNADTDITTDSKVFLRTNVIVKTNK